MTDEQVNLLAESLRVSSFQDDLIVAVVSGVIILLASTMVSFIISRHENEKAKGEMRDRIKLETEESLKAKRIFYLEQVELQDYLNLEDELEQMKVLAQEFTDKHIDSEEFRRLDFLDRIGSTLPYLQRISKFEKKVINITKQYEFNESEASAIQKSAKSLSGYFSGVLEHYNLLIYDDVEAFDGLINEINNCWEIVSNKRFELYERMKQVDPKENVDEM